MQDEQAHTAEHPPMHPVDHGVVDPSVGRVAPPGEDIGAAEDFLAQPVFGLILGRGPDLDGVAEEVDQAGRDGTVHAVRIALRHAGLVAVGMLMKVLAPDGDADR